MLRFLVLAFSAAIVLIGCVVVVLDRFGGLRAHLSGVGVAIAVAVIGFAAVTAAAVAGSLDGTSDSTLAGSYRTRFFLRLALSESAALCGFVGFVLTVNPATYLIGAAFTAIGFWRLTPTAGHLARDQERLIDAGCNQSLVATLRTGMPPAIWRG